MSSRELYDAAVAGNVELVQQLAQQHPEWVNEPCGNHGEAALQAEDSGEDGGGGEALCCLLNTRRQVAPWHGGWAGLPRHLSRRCHTVGVKSVTLLSMLQLDNKIINQLS